ncbi:MAG TPA: nucleotidyltransferase family protein [Fimbriimonas sp.]|nr:nucleotidyltransferase family protein [Fimbriimonas sp.]
MPTYDAILPAGGRIKPDFASVVGTDVKALIKFEGESILEKTLKALRETGRIGRMAVIGCDEVRKASKSLADDVLPEGASGPENILRGLKDLISKPNASEKVFLVTTDLPFLSREIVDRYLDQCSDGRDINVPLVSRDQWEQRFPGTTATFAKLADGTWTTGCAFLIDVGALENSMPQIEQVFNNRKSVMGMAKLLGPKFLFKFATKTLTVPDIEVKIQQMLGCTGAAIRNAPTELAYDIDALDDYEYAVKEFQAR